MGLRPTVPLALTLSALLLAAPTPAQQESRPLFSAGSTELVVLPVVVTRGDGRFVSGLTQDRFGVYDNGRRQNVSLFSNADTPVTLGLVVDDSSSMGPKQGEVIAAALALARSSNPEDRVFAIDFNDHVHQTSTGEPLFANDLQSINAALSRIVPEGRTALYDALLAALDRAAADAAASARKVLVVISDGGDNASAARLAEVLERARHENVTIYTIGLFDEGDRDSNPRVLKKLAVETGGERFLPSSPGPLMQDVVHIAREIRNGYTIAYVPPEHDGQYHRVRVTVDIPDTRHLSIRTRPGYFSPGSAERSR
jgi:Ca-activated chloride channel family protein